MKTSIFKPTVIFVFILVSCQKKFSPLNEDVKNESVKMHGVIQNIPDNADRYIVFFLTNTSVSQADGPNTGKDANTQYTFVGELPYLFGQIDPRSSYKYAFGLPGPMLLTQSVAQMQDEINNAFDLAEKYNVPVYFQLDDCNNYTTQFGSGAASQFYNPDWCEWVSFPANGETWGGQLNGRVPYYWFNWGAWMHAQGFPCFESPGFKTFVLGQLQDGVLTPLINRYNQLVNKGKEYLFAGLAVGWETHIPDYSSSNTILHVDPNNRPVNVLANDQMASWEVNKYGYHALQQRGYTYYDRAVLYQVIHDYSELLASTVNQAGIPRHKIFTHMVGFTSKDANLQTTFAPPIWAAVNDYSVPGYTLSPVSCPYNLNKLVNEVQAANSQVHNFANAEGYSLGVNGSFQEADNYFADMFGNGALSVAVFGWGREPNTSAFAVSHSDTSMFVQAAKKWLGNKAVEWKFNTTVEGWTAENDISSFGWGNKGYIEGDITGPDAYINSGSGLLWNITNNNIITIRLKNNSPQTIGQIYFTTTTDNIWNDDKHKDFTLVANSDYTIYTIDMSTVPGWTGQLSQFRIDPSNALPNTIVGGSFQLDYIHIGQYGWDFTTDAAGWTVGNQVNNFSWNSEAGGYVGGTITGADAYINSQTGLNIDLTLNKYITIRMKNNSSQSIGQIYFTTTTDNVWNNFKHMDFTLSTNSGYVTYLIDMTGLATWTGQLAQIRIDPSNALPGTPVNGTFQIDYVAIGNR